MLTQDLPTNENKMIKLLADQMPCIKRQRLKTHSDASYFHDTNKQELSKRKWEIGLPNFNKSCAFHNDQCPRPAVISKFGKS